jgi:hypothetical protein
MAAKKSKRSVLFRGPKVKKRPSKKACRGRTGLKKNVFEGLG